MTESDIDQRNHRPPKKYGFWEPYYSVLEHKLEDC